MFKGSSIRWLISDFLILNGTSFFSILVRFDGNFPDNYFKSAFLFGIFFSTLFFITGSLFSVYSDRYLKNSFDEFFSIFMSCVITQAVSLTICVLFFTDIPRSIPVITGIFGFIGLTGCRILISPSHLLFLSKRKSNESFQTLIYGAGDAGRQIIEQIILSKSEYNIIGFLDNDPQKSNLRIHRKPVLGDITKLESVVAQFNVELLVVAIAAIDSISLGNLENRCRDLGIKIRVIPSSLQLLTGNVTIDQIQDISPENFLGRRVVRQDNSSLFEFVQGKRVLITGAGGSIGSELAKQIHGLNPEKLCLVDRDETALLNLQLRVDGIGNLTDESLVLADIRDLQRMNEIFLAFKPHIVLHAAALKHLTTLERFPNEAYKTNVLGTQNILKIALNVNVETFINISTDKAADPTSALGRSKLSTERMIASIPNINGKYISVRFGNVIGSQGSFLHTFKFQIRNGGPVTITHPDVSRFFMTISEASNLVLHAGVIGLHGQTLVLEMGNPVKIEEVARRMIRDSGKKIEIKYSGLREGEKLSEVLIAPTEKVSQTSNPSIYATKVEGWPDWSNLEFNQVFPLEMPSGN